MVSGAGPSGRDPAEAARQPKSNLGAGRCNTAKPRFALECDLKCFIRRLAKVEKKVCDASGTEQAAEAVDAVAFGAVLVCGYEVLGFGQLEPR